MIIVRITLYSLAILMHLIGLYLLIAVKLKRSSGRTNGILSKINTRLLILLSISELSGGLFGLVKTITGSYLTKQLVLVESISLYLGWISQSVCLATVYAITLNRLLSALYPFRYMGEMTKTKFSIIYLCLLMVCSLFYGGAYVLFWFGGTQQRQLIAVSVGNFIIFSYFIFCVFTYVKVAMTVLKSRRDIQSNFSHQNTITARSFLWIRIKRQGYVTPLLITLSYLLFVAIPVLLDLFCLLANDFNWDQN